ncbi:tRNA pseudouridine synthase 1 [Chytridiales sp. JEL 0842]|nr:tRNA pseudouridine synthase 1 [Chytridiales sp. JEL 0842]
MTVPLESNTIRLAILFGYCGSQYKGLERTKGEQTIEAEILKALATLTGQSQGADKVTMVNISRASTTEEGEHATRQVISLEIVGEAKIPTADAMNAILPESIRVYKIIRPDEGFSARRNCEMRTYEYIFPSYVFAPPPSQTGYANEYQPDMSREEMDFLYPEHYPDQGTLFTTMMRTNRRSLSRKRTADRTGGRGTMSPPEYSEMPTPPGSPAMEEEQPKKKGGFAKLMDVFRGRSKSRKDKKGSTQNSHATLHSTPTTSTEAIDDRSRSAPPARSRSQSLARSFVYEQEDPNDLETPEPQFFDPIPIPPLTEERKSILRQYRANAEQLEALKHLTSLFKGTHNFHNYIPGASQEDSRCFMRIVGMEVSPQPEVHFGMEWIRVKIQAKAFARYQLRRMMALIIMVIRTNTPRSVVGNSFGVAKIEIPEAPANGLILDQPFYDEYNDAPTRSGYGSKILFDGEKSDIERFRKAQIHDKIYRDEEDMMLFGEWLRSVDTYAFLYTHFLNDRGLIRPRTNFLRLPSAAGEESKIYEHNDKKAVMA